MCFDEAIVEAVKPYADSVIVCLETAADLYMISNGVVFEDLFRVFSPKPIDSDILTVEVVPDCFKSKRFVQECGIFVTTAEQTLIDLLEYESDVNIQTLLESFSNYYFMHGCSFESIESHLTEKQLTALNKWRQDAIDYYRET